MEGASSLGNASALNAGCQCVSMDERLLAQALKQEGLDVGAAELLASHKP